MTSEMRFCTREMTKKKKVTSAVTYWAGDKKSDAAWFHVILLLPLTGLSVLPV